MGGRMKKKDCENECQASDGVVIGHCQDCYEEQLDAALAEVERLEAIILSKIPFHPIWIK